MNILRSFYCFITANVASTASLPLFILLKACFLFKHVKMPLPIGFLCKIDMLSKLSVTAIDINSKCGVFPLITQPNATTPSTLFICLDIVTGISKTPGTLIILYIFIPFKLLLAVFGSPGMPNDSKNLGLYMPAWCKC